MSTVLIINKKKLYFDDISVSVFAFVRFQIRAVWWITNVPIFRNADEKFEKSIPSGYMNIFVLSRAQKSFNKWTDKMPRFDTLNGRNMLNNHFGLWTDEHSYPVAHKWKDAKAYVQALKIYTKSLLVGLILFMKKFTAQRDEL